MARERVLSGMRPSGHPATCGKLPGGGSRTGSSFKIPTIGFYFSATGTLLRPPRHSQVPHTRYEMAADWLGDGLDSRALAVFIQRWCRSTPSCICGSEWWTTGLLARARPDVS